MRRIAEHLLKMSGQSSPKQEFSSFDESTNDSTLSTDDGSTYDSTLSTDDGEATNDAGASRASVSVKQARKKKLPKDPEAPKRPQR